MIFQPFVLFVDDDQRALRQFAIDFDREAKLAVQVLEPSEYEAIANAIDRPDLKLVLIDRVFAKGSFLPVMEMIARDATRKLTVPAYIISGVDVQPDELEAELKQWQGSVGKILDIRGFLKKPLSKDLLLGLVDIPNNEGKSEALSQLRAIVSAFDVPARLVDRSRVPRASNKGWEVWGDNNPNPITQCNCSPSYAGRAKDRFCRVRRIASRAEIERRLAVSRVERMSA